VGPFVSAPGSSFLSDRDVTAQTFLEWIGSGTGPVQCSRAEATYTWSSSYAKREGYDKFPDLHTYFSAWSISAGYERDLAAAFNIDRGISRRYYGQAKGKDSFFQLVTLNKVFGAGTIKLKSKDPLAHPLIDPMYLQHPRDVEALVEGDAG